MCFNSRTPGGVRLFPADRAATKGTFQFTHPGRGATVPKGVRLTIPEVSIHAPREGCDQQKVHRATCPVSIHAPREGCD